MRPLIRILLLVILATATTAVGAVTHEVVSAFALPPQNPGNGSLTLASDGYFWGTTQNGGAYERGTIIKVRADGTDWKLVHSFADGRAPNCKLLDDSTGYLWGTTRLGGEYGNGTVFKVNIVTGELTTVVSLRDTGAIDPGWVPNGALVLDDAGQLWGTTERGRTGNYGFLGTVFKLNRATGELTTVIEFGGFGAIRGMNPTAGLVKDAAGNLWGTTSNGGGAFEGGTIFKINPVTGVLTTVVLFEARVPKGELLFDGVDTFWGTAVSSDFSDPGIVFKVSVSTGELTTIGTFDRADSPAGGVRVPASGLAMDESGNLWGSANFGGEFLYGGVFKVNPSTGIITTVLSFTGDGATNRGSNPRCALVGDGTGSLLGTTWSGGSLDYGTVFKVDIQTGVLTTLVEFMDVPGHTRGAIPTNGLISDGGDFLWGTTSQGGAYGFGTVFKLHAATGEVATVIEFTSNGAENRGSFPECTLMSDGAGYIWGTTHFGGANDSGTVFKIEVESGKLTTVVDFYSDFETRGAEPIAGLAKDGEGFLWGTTSRGGTDLKGTVYVIDPSTGDFFTVLDFNGASGDNMGSVPYGGMIYDGNGFLWGTTVMGGGGYSNGFGTVFKINTATGELTTVVEFTNYLSTNSGAFPSGTLVEFGAGYLLGTTNIGPYSDSGGGTVFKVDKATGAVTTLAAFAREDRPLEGGKPYAGLVPDSTGFYLGTTTTTIFRVNPATGEISTVLEFTGSGSQPCSGASPGYGSIVRHSDGHFYGTTISGGPNGGGTVYRLRVGPPPETQPADQITGTSARLRASANPNAVTTEGTFLWGTNPSALGNLISPAINLGNGTIPVQYDATISGFQPGTTYYFRAKSTNLNTNIAEGGAVLSFTTTGPPPAITTLMPIKVTTEGATLRANVSPNGISTTVEFFLDDELRGSVVVGSGKKSIDVELAVAGLDAATVYDLKTLATSVAGATEGGLLQFATAAAPTTLQMSATPVPGAGTTGTNVPAGAVWTTFGVPAINDAHQVAYIGSWASPSSRGSGIFLDDALIVKTGDTVPGIAGAKFKSLMDPVLNDDGRIAFIATISGSGVTTANDRVVVTDGLQASTSTLQVVARTGASAPGTGSAPFDRFTGIAILGSESRSASLVLQAFLRQGAGSPTVTRNSDQAIWVANGTGPTSLSLVFREGSYVSNLGLPQAVKAFNPFMVVPGSPGQGRAFGIPSIPAFTVTLSSGEQALLQIGEFPEAMITTGNESGWKSFGPLTTALDGFAMRATPFAGSPSGSGIYRRESGNDEWDLIAGESDPAPGLPGVTFRSFKDPVLAPFGGGTAFNASLRGSHVTHSNDSSLWWRPSDGSLTLLAREGERAPGGGAWKSFTSLALPGGSGGPIFGATLSGTSGNGVWGVNLQGELRSYVRTGDSVAGKTVKGFTVLKSTSGSPGVTRAFNNHGRLVWRASFTDGSQGIVITRMP